MQENQLCAVTAENRAMVGFVGCDNEYLVIPPEVTLDGKCCPLSVISGKAFLRCGSLTHVVVMDGYPELIQSKKELNLRYEEKV